MAGECTNCGHVHPIGYGGEPSGVCGYRCNCYQHGKPPESDLAQLVARIDRLTAAIEALTEKKT